MTTPRGLIALVVGVLVAGAGVVAWAVLSRDPGAPTEPGAAPTAVPTDAPVPDTPPTDDARTPGPGDADDPGGPDGPDDPPAPADPADGAAAPGPTTVTVTFWGYDPAAAAVVVGGYADVVETGGTCTLTLTRGTSTATATASAVPDAATTSCGTVTVPRDQLSPGTWTAELRYASPTAAGSAAPVTIEVQ